MNVKHETQDITLRWGRLSYVKIVFLDLRRQDGRILKMLLWASLTLSLLHLGSMNLNQL